MKRLIALASLLAFSSSAAVITFDLSPPGTDNAVGLSPLNESSAVIGSTGSGNEIGSGISFDTETLMLNLSLAYGSAFGFTDLVVPASATHIHGPAPTNTPAPVVIDLAGLHVLATNPATGGSFVGSVLLTTNQAADLLAGLYYINIHTPTNPAGEIRGQLIPVNTLPTLVCPDAATAECAGGIGTFVNLVAQVADDEGDALTVIWSVNGTALQTNSVPAGTTNLTAVEFGALYQLGTNSVTVSVSDGFDTPSECTTTVTIIDTQPPVITSASVTPDVLWPPNHKLIPVQVSITATDICSSVVTQIIGITSSQPVTGKGSGKTSPDWQITGDLSARVRSERSGTDKNGRTYTLTIAAIDTSGNSATTNLTVFVPHSQKGGKKNQVQLPSQAQSGNGNGNANTNSNGNGNGQGNGKGQGKK